MSSSAHIQWERDEGPSSTKLEIDLQNILNDIQKENNEEYAKQIRVTVEYSRPPSNINNIEVWTHWMGESMDGVARMAAMVWEKYGGTLHADPEIRWRIAKHETV
jgi:hypothetical protein